MSFDPISRTQFNQSDTDLNVQIQSEIGKIEAEAREIRKAGLNPELELRPKVEQLKAAIEVGRFQTIEQIRTIHTEARSEWEKARDKKPDAELARIRRAENRFKGMGDDDVAALAESYTGGEADLSIVELNEIRGRLRSNGAELDVLNLAVKERRGDSPWISKDEEMTKLADYGDTLSGFKSDEILVQSEEYGADRFRLDDLIDYEGELAGPDTGDL